ncbi:Hypp7565 [Branchiostoma lanceolatum]|uniref:Hypp7565 protein n=1 Tax=Branchiostoma lanceolatum TaxID=7740 RepID=A0A8K0EB78_BRALA|nr:Hypp7565 [Branchiostoma lanceolatum]
MRGCVVLLVVLCAFWLGADASLYTTGLRYGTYPNIREVTRRHCERGSKKYMPGSLWKDMDCYMYECNSREWAVYVDSDIGMGILYDCDEWLDETCDRKSQCH